MMIQSERGPPGRVWRRERERGASETDRQTDRQSETLVESVRIEWAESILASWANERDTFGRVQWTDTLLTVSHIYIYIHTHTNTFIHTNSHTNTYKPSVVVISTYRTNLNRGPRTRVDTRGHLDQAVRRLDELLPAKWLLFWTSRHHHHNGNNKKHKPRSSVNEISKEEKTDTLYITSPYHRQWQRHARTHSLPVITASVLPCYSFYFLFIYLPTYQSVWSVSNQCCVLCH